MNLLVNFAKKVQEDKMYCSEPATTFYKISECKPTVKTLKQKSIWTVFKTILYVIHYKLSFESWIVFNLKQLKALIIACVENINIYTVHLFIYY